MTTTESLLAIVSFIAVFLIPAVISYLIYKKLKFNKYMNLIISIVIFLILMFALLFIRMEQCIQQAILPPV